MKIKGSGSGRSVDNECGTSGPVGPGPGVWGSDMLNKATRINTAIRIGTLSGPPLLCLPGLKG